MSQEVQQKIIIYRAPQVFSLAVDVKKLSRPLKTSCSILARPIISVAQITIIPEVHCWCLKGNWLIIKLVHNSCLHFGAGRTHRTQPNKFHCIYTLLKKWYADGGQAFPNFVENFCLNAARIPDIFYGHCRTPLRQTAWQCRVRFDALQRYEISLLSGEKCWPFGDFRA